jgi:SAM-dependent methyltransferase
MTPGNDEARSHYAALLARNYAWMAGGMDPGIANNLRFLKEHAITPAGNGTAVDLGAGCGFSSIALASGGFSVVAVDFSEPMLDTLSRQTGDLPIRIIHADILEFTLWVDLHPELIACMGDTLTHLPDMSAVQDLIRHCAHELMHGGKIILSLRDYSREPEGTSAIIPVRRDPDRIFVCRLDYGKEKVRVTDILYSLEYGKWTRAAGSYPKLRIAPEVLTTIITAEGLVVLEMTGEPGMITIIAKKPGIPS